MYFRNSVAIVLWNTVAFSANVVAQDIVIYRWLDENNVVHFSQQQPQSGNYTQLTAVSAQAREKEPLDSASNAMENEQMSQYEKDKAEILAKNAEIAQQNCKAALLNEKMLNSFDNIMMTDTDGKNNLMSDKEKKEQLLLNKKHISMFCNKNDINKN